MIKNLGKLVYRGSGTRTEYLDQLKEEDAWISRAFMSRYLKRTYGLSIQEYYNLVVYGSKEATPKCPYCGNNKAFYKLIYGYYYTCSSHDCIRKKHSDDNANHWKEYTDEEYRSLCSKLGFASKSTLLRARAEYSRCMNNLDHNKVFYLYIAHKNNYLKFGITSDMKQRSHRMNYDDYEILGEGILSRMALIELKIKEELGIINEYLELSEEPKLRSLINKLLTDHK